MKKLIIAAIVAPIAIVVAGCSLTADGVTSTTDSTVTAFQNMCLALPSAHSNFLSIAMAFNVKQSILDGELKAYNAGVAFCASGIVGDAAAAVKTAATFVQQINDAKNKAAGS